MSNFMTNEEILQRVDYLLKDHFETVANANEEHSKQVSEINARSLIALKEQHADVYRAHLDALNKTFPTLRERFAGWAMQGLLAARSKETLIISSAIIEDAGLYADALISELGKTK